MYKTKDLPLQKYWKYADELEGRGVILSYPQKIIKRIKTEFYKNKCKFHIDSRFEFEITNDNNKKCNIKITPNAVSALNYFFSEREKEQVFNCPKTKEIYEVLIETDKYFSMMITLEEVLSKINNCIHQAEYKYASIILAQLTEKYNMEIIDLVNDYLMKHPKFIKNEKGGYRHYFSIMINKSYIVSNKSYIAILIFKNPLYSYAFNEPKPILIYENYNVLSEVSKHRVKPQGSFLEDCKAIALLKKQLGFGSISLLEFHDLMEYGYYNDSILSIENMEKVSEIFNYTSWIHHFFLALSLYCDKMITIEDIQKKVKEKSLVDTRKINNLDRFGEVVRYYDSIYDSLIEK